MSNEPKNRVREDLCDKVEPNISILLLVRDEGLGSSYLGVRCSYRTSSKQCRNSSNSSGRCQYEARNFLFRSFFK